MAASKPSCAVLGGGGFIGTNLCRGLLAAGHRVRAFGRTRRFPEALHGVEWLQGDFADADAVAGAIYGCDRVFHLVHAAMPQAANQAMAADVANNIVPSLALLELCRKHGVKRVVFASSGGMVYGRARQIPTPETAPTEPISAYGISKLAIEKYLALYQHLYGLDFRVLRMANPYGRFQTDAKGQGFIAAAIRCGLSGQPIEIWGDGSAVRDFVFIDDVIDAFTAAADDSSGERIFNIGSGEGRSLTEVVRAVERALGTTLRIEWKPGRALDVPRSEVAIDRAHAVLGWTPKTPFEAGLAATAAWLGEAEPSGS